LFGVASPSACPILGFPSQSLPEISKEIGEIREDLSKQVTSLFPKNMFHYNPESCYVIPIGLHDTMPVPTGSNGDSAPKGDTPKSSIVKKAC
jgi:hypothetical protein